MASFSLVHSLVLIGVLPAMADLPVALGLPAWSPGLLALSSLGAFAGLVGL